MSIDNQNSSISTAAYSHLSALISSGALDSALDLSEKYISTLGAADRVSIFTRVMGDMESTAAGSSAVFLIAFNDENEASLPTISALLKFILALRSSIGIDALDSLILRSFNVIENGLRGSAYHSGDSFYGFVQDFAKGVKPDNSELTRVLITGNTVFFESLLEAYGIDDLNTKVGIKNFPALPSLFIDDDYHSVSFASGASGASGASERTYFPKRKEDPYFNTISSEKLLRMCEIADKYGIEGLFFSKDPDLDPVCSVYEIPEDTSEAVKWKKQVNLPIISESRSEVKNSAYIFAARSLITDFPSLAPAFKRVPCVVTPDFSKSIGAHFFEKSLLKNDTNNSVEIGFNYFGKSREDYCQEDDHEIILDAKIMNAYISQFDALGADMEDHLGLCLVDIDVLDTMHMETPSDKDIDAARSNILSGLDISLVSRMSNCLFGSKTIVSREDCLVGITADSGDFYNTLPQVLYKMHNYGMDVSSIARKLSKHLSQRPDIYSHALSCIYGLGQSNPAGLLPDGSKKGIDLSLFYYDEGELVEIIEKCDLDLSDVNVLSRKVCKTDEENMALEVALDRAGFWPYKGVKREDAVKALKKLGKMDIDDISFNAARYPYMVMVESDGFKSVFEHKNFPLVSDVLIRIYGQERVADEIKKSGIKSPKLKSISIQSDFSI